MLDNLNVEFEEMEVEELQEKVDGGLNTGSLSSVISLLRK